MVQTCSLSTLGNRNKSHRPVVHPAQKNNRLARASPPRSGAIPTASAKQLSNSNQSTIPHHTLRLRHVHPNLENAANRLETNQIPRWPLSRQLAERLPVSPALGSPPEVRCSPVPLDSLLERSHQRPNISRTTNDAVTTNILTRNLTKSRLHNLVAMPRRPELYDAGALAHHDRGEYC